MSTPQSKRIVPVNMPVLASARYGKDNVRLCKVHKNAETGIQTVSEMTVCCLLEGNIETSYTVADNSIVVATDSIKNTIYIKAKEHPVNPPELFAATLAQHFLDKYNHITIAHVNIAVHRWTRMTIDGKPHPHSFYRDGEELRTVSANAFKSPAKLEIASGIKKLTVLKSTGSAFHGFVRDEFTTLGETWDRILSTDIDCTWTWKAFSSLKEVEDAAHKFDPAWSTARDTTMKIFAEDESASVQNTMYKMCGDILEKVPDVAKIGYSLPNKHYFEIDLGWHKGLKNTGKDAEVYAPQSGPNGLILCEVVRP